MKKHLIIVDLSNFIFRAFYAIRMLNAPDGTPVNAVRGVLGMLQKILAQYRPTHMFIARDSKEKSFRHQLYENYKANRSAPPEDLVPQFALIEELVNQMELTSLSVPGFEADDVIGSVVVQWQDEFDQIYIASGDKDLMQFVNGKVKLLDTMKNRLLGAAEVKEKMGVEPQQIVDYLTMVGDSSDNIPGMKGIGAKGAAKLLATYGTLENCIAHREELKGKKLVQAFNDHLEDARLSKELVTIKTDIPLPNGPEETVYQFYPRPELFRFLENLGFNTTLDKLKDLAYSVHQAEKSDARNQFDGVEAQEKSYRSQVVATPQLATALCTELASSPMVALHLEFDHGNLFQAHCCSLALTLDGQKVYFLRDEPNGRQLIDEILSVLVAREDLEIYVYDGKRWAFFEGLRQRSIGAQLFDIAQVNYILDTADRHDLVSLISKLTSTVPQKLAKGESFQELSPSQQEEYMAQRVIGIFMVAEQLKSRLFKEKLDKLYYEVDGPMIQVLADMERHGVHLNREFLQELEEDFSQQLNAIERQVAEVAQVVDKADFEVNLKSPKQVSELLFQKLQLPIIKKTKTGYSTDVEVLEELAAQNQSEVPALLLKYRELDKILSTYVKALPKMINPISQRIHTTFHQNVAATGRLSSDSPNLQNIPIRSENGRLVRKAFVAQPGKLLLGADYSQIELRILASLSEDPTMLAAFHQGVDIHTQTASEIMNVPLEKVSREERSQAKAVNFGLMYGQSSFGLARALRISRQEAREYIGKYFERFSRVKAYLDSLKDKAEARGYSETLLGRKRYLPEIHSSNRTIKSNAERVAVNSPIQGTAADIIKLAMIRIARQLEQQQLSSVMLLQVHDELIFEVPESELRQLKELVRQEMEGAMELKVPLKVEMGIGVNWYDLK